MTMRQKRMILVRFGVPFDLVITLTRGEVNEFIGVLRSSGLT